MQHLVLPGLVLFIVCTNAFSQEATLRVPRVDVDRQAVTPEGANGNVLPEANPFRDFMDRLKAAIEKPDTSALEALYQTNGVSADQLKEELHRWEPMFLHDAGLKVSIQARGCFFRDFNRSNRMWKKLAERLTTYQATHLVELPTSAGYWMLPLVEVEGRLLLVPSDKSKDMALRWEDVQPDSPANPSQPPRTGK